MNSRSDIEASESSRTAKTRWSLIAAAREGNAAEQQRVIGEMCERYLVPVYFYVRRSGHSPEAAERLARAFLGNVVQRLRADDDPISNSFRQYLQDRLVGFLRDPPAIDRPAAQSDEALPPVSLDQIEHRYIAGVLDKMTPEQAMQRGFALELLARALVRLGHEAAHAGRGELFDVVRPWLSREPAEEDYRKLAAQTGSSALAMIVAVKRLRQRFQEIVDDELLLSTGDAVEVSHERQTMLSMVAPDLSGE